MLFLALVLLGAPGALAVACNNPVPGLNKQAHGVDVTRLDLMPVDPLTDSGGIKGAVFSYTCDKGTKITIDGKTYDQPDQVWSIYSIPTGSVSSTVSIQKTSKETRNSMSVNAGVEGTIKGFTFSASTTYSKSQSSLVKRNKLVAIASASFGTRRMDLVHRDGLSLGTTAQAQLDKLPSNYADNAIGYETFVKDFGTHYVSTGTFGGIIMQYTETNVKYLETNSEESLSVDVKASYASVISAYGGVTTTSGTSSTAFNSQTTKTIRYYGGSANLLSSGGISSWQPTIASDPWLFSTKLVPLYDLVRDTSKQAALKTATEDYVMRVYLTVELPRILGNLDYSIQAGSDVQTLLNKINTMKNKRPLVASEVSALGQEVENKFKYLYYKYHKDHAALVTLNTIMGEIKYDCPPGKVPTRIRSWHEDYYDDRVFQMACSYPPTLPTLTGCAWSDYVHGIMQDFAGWYCPGNGILRTLYSYHSDWHDDRQFKFYCCQLERASRGSCWWSGYVNSYMNTFDYHVPENTAIVGVASKHSDYYDDRIFSFYICTLNGY